MSDPLKPGATPVPAEDLFAAAGIAVSETAPAPAVRAAFVATLASTGDGPLKRLYDDNFLRYASYVIRDRAIPELNDGLKPVQRRILFSLHENDDGKYTKVANIVGYCMQFHPHGDAAIGDALVTLANKQFLIDRQGNFGNTLTGDPAAAARYIECRLTELARTELFNDELTEFVPTYDGRKQEPVTLPAKLPLLLMQGAEGIAVGLSTRILPHNFCELLEAQIAILQKKPFRLVPDFFQGGRMDAADYDDGRGCVRLRAKIETRDAKTLVVRELPFGVTTDGLQASIEDAARRGKVRVRSLQDFTAGQVEIEISLQADEDPARAIEALYAFTECQVQVSSRIVVIRDQRPAELSVSEVLRHNTARLVELLRAELKLARHKLAEDLHRRTLVQIFIGERIYQRIEACRTADAVQTAVAEGLAPFRPQLVRDVTAADVEMLLGIPIRRISLFDLEKNRREMESLREEAATVEKNLGELVPYAVRYLRGLLKKHGAAFPRRTEVEAFEEIAVRELTSSELQIGYDREKGYLGYAVGGEPLLECSSLDKLLVFWKDGRCKLLAPPEKLFVDKNAIYCAVADRERVLTVVYDDSGLTYAKKFGGGMILNKEYGCIPKGAQIRMLADDDPETLFVQYETSGSLAIRQQEFPAKALPVRERTSRGVLMTSKRVKFVGPAKPRNWDDAQTGPRGKFQNF